MDRQNQKLRKKHQDGERKRVIKLVETAERFDPRIRAEREAKEAKKREEKEKKARAKQEEEEAKQRKVEEKRKEEERLQAEKEEKERLAREQNKEMKQVGKSLRQRAKKAVQAKCKIDAILLEEFQTFCLSLENDGLEALCERMEKLPSKQADAEAKVRAELAKWKEDKTKQEEEQARQREEAKLKEKQQAEANKESASGPPWAAEEMTFLAKGLQKFPGGVGGRWALIAKFLCQNGFQRTEKEVIEKTKEMSDGKSLRAMGSEISNDLSTFKQPKAASLAKAAGPLAKAAAESAASPKAAAKAEAKAEAKAAAPAAPVAMVGGDANEWSPEQQKALETALQKHPASLDKNERWKLIAADVPGKTKGQCVERFKFLREQLAAAKK